MAIINDALTEMATIINRAVYPNGTDNPSVVGVDILTYPGWPSPEKLDDAIKEGRVHITIFPRPEERIVSHTPGPWETESIDGDTGISVRALKVQERLVQVTVWAPSPEVRGEVVRVLDVELTAAPRMLMPDGSWARLVPRNSYTDDTAQKTGLFREEMFYFVEYATIQKKTDYVIHESIANIGEMNE